MQGRLFDGKLLKLYHEEECYGKKYGNGQPRKEYPVFALPVFAGNLFQQIYNVVDTVIVGKFVSTEALAAVGSTGTINFMILGFMTGLMAGITVLTSQRFGAEDMRGMRRSVSFCRNDCHCGDHYPDGDQSFGNASPAGVDEYTG